MEVLIRKAPASKWTLLVRDVSTSGSKITNPTTFFRCSKIIRWRQITLQYSVQISDPIVRTQTLQSQCLFSCATSYVLFTTQYSWSTHLSPVTPASIRMTIMMTNRSVKCSLVEAATQKLRHHTLVVPPAVLFDTTAEGIWGGMRRKQPVLITGNFSLVVPGNHS